MRLQFIDIALNLTDSMFRGVYRSPKQTHPDDLKNVLDRARDVGVVSAILTGGSLSESKEVHALAEELDGFYSTAGLHPTRSNEFNESFINDLEAFIKANRFPGTSNGRVVALGECGLDWDRLHFSDKPTQIKAFTEQLKLAQKLNIPLFLHSRNCHDDLVKTIKSACGDNLPKGCVHSFTGSIDEMQELVSLGFYIGLNGCSLKTEDNLDVAKAIPLDRLMVETDAPWCSVTSTHASYPHLETLPDEYKLPPAVKKEKWSANAPVKSRNEPGFTPAIAHIIASAKNVPLDTVAEVAYRNTCELFQL
ncbi:Mg-dependent DNase [Wallemia mellicola]|nr:Mg-dependent DNase [Wallemia mellicola]